MRKTLIHVYSERHMVSLQVDERLARLQQRKGRPRGNAEVCAAVSYHKRPQILDSLPTPCRGSAPQTRGSLNRKRGSVISLQVDSPQKEHCGF